MNYFRAEAIAAIGGQLQIVIGGCQFAIGQGHPGHPVESELLQLFTQMIPKARAFFNEVGLKQSLRQFELAVKSTQLTTLNVSILRTSLLTVQDTLFHELSDRRFLYVAPDRDSYLDKAALFGPKVATAFKAASDDIRAAGDCLAAECSTASVFHLMRVAEHGLRALAYDRRIRLNKNRPLSLASWEAIIVKLEDAETEIQGYPQSLAREAQYDFYHGAMMQFRGFKNVFRNQIMHTRKHYDRDRALRARQRITD